VEALVGKPLAGLEREQPVDPVADRLVVHHVLPHAEHREAEGEAGQRLRLDEPAQRRRFVGRKALVGVEREDPGRLELCSGFEEAAAVRPVVPAAVALPGRVREQDLDERASGEQLARAVRRAVVESDHGVGERRDRVEIPRQVLGAVPDRQQADERAAFAHRPFSA